MSKEMTNALETVDGGGSKEQKCSPKRLEQSDLVKELSGRGWPVVCPTGGYWGLRLTR